MNARTRQSGLSLIELMVALTIGILLLLGTTSLFISNKRIYREQEEIGRMQENARYALEQLVRDIRMSVYSGCADDISTVTNHLNGGSDDDALLSFANGIEGSENKANWAPSGSTGDVAGMVAGSDAITVRYLDPTGTFLAEEMAATTSNPVTTGSSGAAANDIVAVSDCSGADIFEVSQVSVVDGDDNLLHAAGASGGASPGNVDQPLTKRFGTDAELMRVVTRRYFIGTGSNGPALFMAENYSGSNELIEGVENMQILYGEDTTADSVADSFVTAAAVTNWDNVVSVQIALLMRTVEENFDNDLDTRTYNLLGTNVDPTDDHRRRRIFTATVQIRNRISSAI